MTYKRFYSERLNAQILEEIDAEHKKKIRLLIKETVRRRSFGKRRPQRDRKSVV